MHELSQNASVETGSTSSSQPHPHLSSQLCYDPLVVVPTLPRLVDKFYPKLSQDLVLNIIYNNLHRYRTFRLLVSYVA